MRFLSHIRRFSVQIQERKVNIVGNGVEQETQPMILAEFWQSDITAAELEFAERTWKKVPGRTTELDEVTPTALLSRLSVFDTDKAAEMHEWDAATKKQVEDKLVARAVTSADYVVVEAPALTPPWPTYDSFRGSVADLAQRVLDDGYHIPAVIEYEKSSLNRSDVIEAYTELWNEIQALAQDTAQDVVPA